VTGAVRSARALHYAFDEDPNPGELTVRPSSDVTVELDAVPGAGTQLPGCTREHQVLAYRVELEIADVAELPTYVSDEYAALTPVIGSSPVRPAERRVASHRAIRALSWGRRTHPRRVRDHRLQPPP
jgi:hypothetical protein